MLPTPDEVLAIADAITPRHRALVYVGAGLGLRQGEAFGLARDRIDFDGGVVRIDQQLVRARSKLTLGPPKTARSYRRLPLPDVVAEALAEHISRFPSDDPEGLVFTSTWGARLRRDGWNRRYWKPAVAAVGRPELTFHALRHFCASALIRDGRSAPSVAGFMGHSPATLLRVYAHAFPSDDELVRGAIEHTLRPAGDNVVRLRA